MYRRLTGFKTRKPGARTATTPKPVPARPFLPASPWKNSFPTTISGQSTKRGTITRAANALLTRSEEHTSELQSRLHLVCRLLLEKKKNKKKHEELLASPEPKRPVHDTKKSIQS